MSSYRQVGLLINGIEFIPQNIVEKHLPFATPPNTIVEAVFAEAESDYATAPVEQVMREQGLRVEWDELRDINVGLQDENDELRADLKSATASYRKALAVVEAAKIAHDGDCPVCDATNFACPLGDALNELEASQGDEVEAVA